jgi:hypothetical protein
MRLLLLHRVVLILLFLGLFQCPRSAGCGCLAPENLTEYELVKKSVDRADSVFIGIPRLLHGDGSSNETEDLVVFDVLQVFKGAQGAQIGVHSGIGKTEMSSCGYSFEVGKTYLVFANSYDGSRLMVAACSYTAPVERSGTALRLLRKEPPNGDDLLTPSEFQKSSKGRILGVVRRTDGSAVLHARVYIWDESDTSYERPGWPASEEWPQDKNGSLGAFLLARSTLVEKSGAFESDFLVPGVYRVTVVDDGSGPDRWVGSFSMRPDNVDPATLQVFAGRDCPPVDIVLREQKVFALHGIVRSSDGGPLPSEGLTIRATMAPGGMFPLLEYIQTDALGRFTIERAPVGTVRLAIYGDRNWQETTKDVDVSKDTKQLEIVLTRDGPPNSVTPKLDAHKDPTPESDDDEDSTPD